MFDFKDTAVLMFKVATYVLHFTWDGFGEVNEMKIVTKILFSNNFVYK